MPCICVLYVHIHIYIYIRFVLRGGFKHAFSFSHPLLGVGRFFLLDSFTVCLF